MSYRKIDKNEYAPPDYLGVCALCWKRLTTYYTLLCARVTCECFCCTETLWVRLNKDNIFLDFIFIYDYTIYINKFYANTTRN